MTRVRFWQKPGCRTNARQQQLLAQAGHELEVLDLLSSSWTAETLLPFLAALPVNQWFNRASPRVKSGAVDPFGLDADSALALLIDDPLLIRRPLMEAGEWRCAGFDALVVDRAIGLQLEHDDVSPERHHALAEADASMEGCSHGDTGRTCAAPGRTKRDKPVCGLE